MRGWLGGLLVFIVGCGSSGSSGGGGSGGGGGGGSGGATACDRSVPISGVGTLPSVSWMKTASVDARAVSVDADGNVFVGGELYSSADLGGGPLTGSSFNDAFLVSYSPGGEHRWSKRFGGSGYDRFFGIGVDASGNLYATGEFTPGADLGAGPIAADQVIVASFDKDGAYRWATEIDVSRAYDVAVQGDGIVYVTGEFGGTIDIGGKPLVSAGPVNGFLASLDAQGVHRWATVLGGAGNDNGWAVATDGSGVAVIGTYNGTASLGSGSVTSVGKNDVFVASFDSNGEYRWSTSIGVLGTDWPGGVTLANGLVRTNGSLEIGGSDERDPFFSSFDETGAEGASLKPTGPGFDLATALSVDSNGNVFAAGRFNDTTDLGGGELVATTSSSEAAWVASFDAELEHRWSLTFAWLGPPSGPDHVATGPDGAIYAVGSFSVPLAADGGPFGNAERPFLLKLVENCP